MSEITIIHSAATLAKSWHRGQVDKAGVDYFTGHLTAVGEAGSNWKEKVVGYLHDVAEDTPHTVEETIALIRKESNGILAENDAEEIAAALRLLNSHTASSREEYIERLRGNELAIKVKLNDLRHNMDLSRIPNPTDKDRQRVERYQNEYNIILNYCYDQNRTSK